MVLYNFCKILHVTGTTAAKSTKRGPVIHPRSRRLVPRADCMDQLNWSARVSHKSIATEFLLNDASVACKQEKRHIIVNTRTIDPENDSAQNFLLVDGQIQPDSNPAQTTTARSTCEFHESFPLPHMHLSATANKSRRKNNAGKKCMI